ncbi:V-set and immunoglobulin domain-containing protein 8b [Colossoma macropomum]|uniref:V-set and immunoglobulin domain-containing protein 8b n=1 Tax=Colossoma macropomum TaxID=42526 RepID=UPI0018647D2D|nr:V-set and immunoglobulin domain-containing protein 8b [Colossoma macropomum]XP_036434801.1 V-set and immunoglobulin domain-containing protein 8b [Colossoma macropomum]
MVNHSIGCQVSLVVLFAIVVCLDHAAAIQVTSTGPQTIKKAQGENVILGCTYSESPSDVGQLDVEWSVVSPDMTQKDNLILSYSGGQEYKLARPDLKSRLKFVGEPSRGDATISITSLCVSETATYQCKVKKPPGIDSRKITLVVLARPSVPKCWVENGEVIGSTVSLRCKSSEGSIPLTYKWTRETGSMPATATQNPQTGELLISNHSQSYTGSYICEVSNEVGKEQCKYTLKAYNPTNKAGIIAGAVIGALLLLLFLLLLIWLLICCCQKRRYEKETANEIKEDAAAPESRPASRHSSFRSIMSYHTHHGIIHNSVRNSQPNRTESGRSNIYTDHSQVPLQVSLPASDYKPPLRYDSRYGYPV